ncbi:hypothetical protein BSP38_108 [Bacillus phage BSP38]|uniref:Uncharacterized protein n=1 Tax=Bacillus phage BSP38 TaxID=2283013 RepID=A0A345MJW8_BPBSP|nr:hypothetical protein HWB82_gp210 [Bacillus phage BSP38]AXH71150.1 hypothetical protein BSP38_108 [Bacillus phage BSP38]
MDKKDRLKDLVFVAATENYSVYLDTTQNRLAFYDGIDLVSVDINMAAFKLLADRKPGTIDWKKRGLEYTLPPYVDEDNSTVNTVRKLQRRDD